MCQKNHFSAALEKRFWLRFLLILFDRCYLWSALRMCWSKHLKVDFPGNSIPSYSIHVSPLDNKKMDPLLRPAVANLREWSPPITWNPAMHKMSLTRINAQSQYVRCCIGVIYIPVQWLYSEGDQWSRKRWHVLFCMYTYIKLMTVDGYTESTPFSPANQNLNIWCLFNFTFILVTLICEWSIVDCSYGVPSTLALRFLITAPKPVRIGMSIDRKIGT